MTTIYPWSMVNVSVTKTRKMVFGIAFSFIMKLSIISKQLSQSFPKVSCNKKFFVTECIYFEPSGEFISVNMSTVVA